MNRTKKIYEPPLMEVVGIEPIIILAGSGDKDQQEPKASLNEWEQGWSSKGNIEY